MEATKIKTINGVNYVNANLYYTDHEKWKLLMQIAARVSELEAQGVHVRDAKFEKER